MPIYRSIKKNKFLRAGLVSCFILLLLLVVPPAGLTAVKRLQVKSGETFALTLSRESSYQSWRVNSDEQDLVNFQSRGTGKNSRDIRFIFRAGSPGTAHLVFKKSIETALVKKRLGSETYVVDISSVRPAKSTQPATESRFKKPDWMKKSPTRSSQAPSRNDRPQIDSQQWQLVEELIERKKFDPAREEIQKQIEKIKKNADDGDTGPLQKRWLEKLAESYYLAEEYQQAIETWRRLIEQYPGATVPEWLYSIAQAYRKNDNDEQAELVLMRIQYKHRGSSIWTKAIKMLGSIAAEQGGIERARQLLEKARRVYKSRSNPLLTLKLAQIYDRFKAVRDYEKAVKYYRAAAQGLRTQAPEKAKKARRRAEYLVENFVNFGIE